MRTSLLIILLAAAVLLGAKYVSTRKTLLAERQAITAAWAQVDAALDQRAGLVPDLLETVPYDASREQGAGNAVQDARAALEQARGPEARIHANNRLDTALARLLLATENYPQLDHSKKLAGLEDALKQAEDHIAVERRKYNEAVEHYNTRIALFPSNIVASLSGLHRIDAYFQTPLGVAGGDPARHAR
jgi:LemA protein